MYKLVLVSRPRINPRPSKAMASDALPNICTLKAKNKCPFFSCGLGALQFSTKIDGNPVYVNNTRLEKFFHFHHLPKLYFGFKAENKCPFFSTCGLGAPCVCAPLESSCYYWCPFKVFRYKWDEM